MTDLHQTLSSMMKADQFEPFVRYIRFPHFRNLRKDTQIEFSHPVTALVGPNGTNKTAILRALQGCPDNYNVGQYWFSTDLDPIRIDPRNRFIHGYLAPSVGEVVEVMKTRISRGGGLRRRTERGTSDRGPVNPDYFEPSRPILQDGMVRMPDLKPGQEMPPERTKTRWKAISKNVVYLDFRSELSAYDKYFYHLPFTRTEASLTEKKNLIRSRSTHLATSFRTGRRQHMFHRSERIIVPPRELPDDQRNVISEMLGRDYTSIRLMSHRYFKVDGYSVLLATSDLQYSEAFAGSGEFAVTMLVTAVMDAQRASLILLDEPEVSLHPGAQRKLMAFLADQSKLNRHQVVISTHSPEIVRDLPANAVKVFLCSETDAKVELIAQASEPTEAFFRLGVRSSRRKAIYVEDALAAAIVRRALRSLGESVNALVEVCVLPGGANSIQTRFIPAFALSNRRDSLILLDGDQRPDAVEGNPSSVSDIDLADVLSSRLHGKPQLSLSGARGTSSDSEKLSQLRTVLNWLHENVDYLPGSKPESLLLEMVGSGEHVGDAKITWEDRARKALGRMHWEEVTSAEILGEQERALAKVDDCSAHLGVIRDRVAEFLRANSL